MHRHTASATTEIFTAASRPEDSWGLGAYRAASSSTIFICASVSSPSPVDGPSSTPSSHPTDTPNRRLRATSFSTSGRAPSDSHL